MKWPIIETMRELEPNLPVKITNVKTGQVLWGIAMYREKGKVKMAFPDGGRDDLRFKDWIWEEETNEIPLCLATYENGVVWGMSTSLEGALADGHSYQEEWAEKFPEKVKRKPFGELQIAFISHSLRIIIEHMGGETKFDVGSYDLTSTSAPFPVLIPRHKKVKA